MSNYHQYELLKNTWVASHPNASNIEYQKAMAEIARKLGI